MIMLFSGIKKSYLRSRPSASMVNKMENLLSTVNIGRLGGRRMCVKEVSYVTQFSHLADTLIQSNVQ